MKPVDILIVQVYMQKTDNDDKEVGKIYDKICNLLHEEGWGQVNAIVIGDFNSIVGEGSTDKAVGTFGLSRRNERDKLLINFCRQYDLLVIINTTGLKWETLTKK